MAPPRSIYVVMQTLSYLIIRRKLRVIRWRWKSALDLGSNGAQRKEALLRP